MKCEKEEITRSEIGVTDIPCCDEKQDLLEMGKYVTGLEKFIKRCPTPMSIAIQGDWGTGKTSTINMLKNRMESEQNIKCVYFNTWQYSQFHMVDDLYVSFVNTLIRECSSDTVGIRNFTKYIQKLGTKYIVNKIEEKIGLDVEEELKNQNEKMEAVEKLKSSFADIIKNELMGHKDGRFVIFIDDLDRLNPEVAVELLEVIKLFMDVKKCIFVLAIDYEVVVSGVRSKYGEGVSEEKCRNFFDKVIQLPFRLPVETYRLENLIRETVQDDIAEEDIESLTEFVTDMLGANPRAYKRLANSYFLIKSVNETLHNQHDPMIDNVLIFTGLCIQMCVPKYYQILASVSDDKNFEELGKCEDASLLKEYLERQKIELELDDKEEKSLVRCQNAYHEFLKGLGKNHKQTTKNIFNYLRGVLQMTAITSVTAGENKKRPPVKVDKIVINGMEKSVENPTEALFQVYSIIWNENMNLLDKFLESDQRILTKDEEKRDKKQSFFRVSKELNGEGKTNVYIGLASSTSDKMKCVNKLCQFMEQQQKEYRVIWKYKEEVIFDSQIDSLNINKDEVNS